MQKQNLDQSKSDTSSSYISHKDDSSYHIVSINKKIYNFS